jgi:catechol-2,3-dioxygenase
MGPLQGIKGMRHIALKVKDIAKAKSFYQNMLGMDVVWEPDPDNVYLSSGYDNIALHQVTAGLASRAAEQQLDHFGVTIVHPFKIHRDGSASFYCADPDAIVIQMLYEPQLSPQALK